MALDPRNLWCIHGKRYDLRNFDTHPGGTRALHVARGRDSTELFESYHALSDRPANMLSKYLAKDQTEVPVPIFDWSKTPFHDDMKVAMRKYFKDNKIDHKCTVVAAARLFLLTVAAAASLYGWYLGHWWSMFCLPWFYWLGPSHMMHSGSHWALSRNPHINIMCARLGAAHVSLTDWYHQHVLGHHMHVNIEGLDPDLTHFLHVGEPGPGFRLHAQQPLLQKHAAWSMAAPMQAAFTTLGPSLINQVDYYASGSFNGIAYLNYSFTRKVLHVIGRLLVFMPLLLLPWLHFPWYKALPFALVPMVTHGVIFYIFSQVSHASDKLEGEGDDGDFQKNEWAVHQVKNCLDYSETSPTWGVLSIGLNCQAVHHLFPQIDTCHYPALAPIFGEVCKKHSVEYVRTANILGALAHHCAHLRVLNEVPGFSPKCTEHTAVKSFIDKVVATEGTALVSPVELSRLLWKDPTAGTMYVLGAIVFGTGSMLSLTTLASIVVASAAAYLGGQLQMLIALADWFGIFTSTVMIVAFAGMIIFPTVELKHIEPHVNNDVNTDLKTARMSTAFKRVKTKPQGALESSSTPDEIRNDRMTDEPAAAVSAPVRAVGDEARHENLAGSYVMVAPQKTNPPKSESGEERDDR